MDEYMEIPRMTWLEKKLYEERQRQPRAVVWEDLCVPAASQQALFRTLEALRDSPQMDIGTRMLAAAVTALLYKHDERIERLASFYVR